MARGIKIKSTFNLKKLANRLDNIVADGLNDMARRLNKSIQENLEKGVDINDKPFEPLGPSRLAQRAKKGTGSKPLIETGKMRKTKIEKATPGNEVATVKMVGKKKGIYYGAEHNEGYIVKKGKFKGSAVPQRKWFGFTKAMERGGVEYKKAMNLIKRKIRFNWKKTGRI